MKKIIIIIFIFILVLPLKILADKKEVIFSKCVDGDTAKIILNNNEITIRFLAIDTPETKHPNKEEEHFGNIASDYTCDILKKAKKINIEYDNNSDILDKYNRHLVWIFVDDELLQAKLIEKGYAKTAYLYNNYKYTNQLLKLENIAKNNQLGIWGDYDEINKVYVYIISALIALAFIFNKKYRKKIIKKIKTKLKK